MSGNEEGISGNNTSGQDSHQVDKELDGSSPSNPIPPPPISNQLHLDQGSLDAIIAGVTAQLSQSHRDQPSSGSQQQDLPDSQRGNPLLGKYSTWCDTEAVPASCDTEAMLY